MANFITDSGHSINDVENFRELSEKEVKDASLLNLSEFGAELAEHFLDKEITQLHYITIFHGLAVEILG